MVEKLDLTQKLLCNKVGKMFELAAQNLSCYELSFCEAWLQSDISKQIQELEETLICQSKTYFLNSFNKSISLPSHEGYKMDSDSMYWIGYLLTYWMFIEDVEGEFILKKYNLKAVLEQYDVLHTMSIKSAIKTIKNDYSNKSVLLDSILHSNK